MKVTGEVRAKSSQNGAMAVEATPSVAFFFVRWWRRLSE